MAETELSVLNRQFLDRRIPDQGTLEAEWRLGDQVAIKAGIKWTGTLQLSARAKLKTLHPTISVK